MSREPCFTDYTAGNVANRYGVPVPSDRQCVEAGSPRHPDAQVGPPIPCPEGCAPSPSGFRDRDACPVCRGCGRVTEARVRRCYGPERVAEIVAPVLLVEV